LRWHIEGRLGYDGIVERDTVRGSSDDKGELVVKKVKTVFQRDLDDFESKMKTLEKLVELLRVRYLEDHLGVEGYRELVLLEGIRPVAGCEEGKKRLAEDSPENDPKRQKVMA